MSDNRKLQKAFQYIRETFFPRWDRQHQWRIKIDPELPSQGRCASEIKTIFFKYVPKSELELHSLLIHEICHSSSPEHGKKWSERMKKARDTARRIGNENLAIKIQDALDNYKRGYAPSAQSIYDKFSDVIMDRPHLSYESILEWIANDIGMYPEELEKKYKKCREAYEKGIKMQKEYSRNRVKLKRLCQKEK